MRKWQIATGGRKITSRQREVFASRFPLICSARAALRASHSFRLAVCGLFIGLILLFAAQSSFAQARRLVLVKIDGLSQATVDRFVGERDARTGKSLLPWFEHIFYQRGTRVANFYVRGMSLSGPSWSLLDTGQHLQIKGNVEFDRLTLHSYDYLNFIPFWLGSAGKVRVDMPGPELLDELGIPLLADSYPYDERHLSFQLYQRGTRWTTLERSLKNRIMTRTPRELFDEWLVEFDGRNILMEQLERELLEKLKDSRIRYLDFYTTDYDHAAHHNRDRATHLAALQEIDRLLGRIWTTIQQTPHAAQTALVVVSDHGTNSDERIYSQGFNLVKLLGSAAGGGHHVITKRRLLSDYALKSVYPLVPLITTTSADSFYLKGQSTNYPTALVDFDGNERASIHLRQSDLNVLHILLTELHTGKLTPALKQAAIDAFFAIIEKHRADWHRMRDELRAELGALRRLIERERALADASPKKWTQAERDAGRDQEARRILPASIRGRRTSASTRNICRRSPIFSRSDAKTSRPCCPSCALPNSSPKARWANRIRSAICSITRSASRRADSPSRPTARSTWSEASPASTISNCCARRWSATACSPALTAAGGFHRDADSGGRPARCIGKRVTGR
jgi:hypothetical protein